MIDLFQGPIVWLIAMLSHPFMRNAFLAGTAVAIATGLVGYFAVLRSQVFIGDALGHAAFTGAMAALVIGVDARLGLFAMTVLVAISMGLLGRRGRADDVVIGSVFAWTLGLGVLFLALFTSNGSTGSNGAAGPTVLFGSIFGLDVNATWLAAVLACLTAGVLVAVARPLLFATLDEAVAEAQGVPVGALGLLFLALIGLSTAEGAQVVGALLLLGLLSAPAATAQRLTDRPFLGLGLSAVLAVASMWLGLTMSYVIPKMPPSFSIIMSAGLIYAVVTVAPFIGWLCRGPQARRRTAGRVI